MFEGQFRAIKPQGSFTQWKTGLDCAQSGLRISNWLGEADSTVTWFLPDSSQPITKGENNGVKSVITKGLLFVYSVYSV